MNIRWENKIRQELTEEIHAVDFPKETQEKIYNQVHLQIRERKVKMRMSRKHTGIILAAALVVIGSITAIGAGKIAFTSGGHSVDEEIQDITALTAKAEQELGETVRIPESFTDEIIFSSGVVNYTQAWDENYNKVGSFPKAMVFYKDGQGRSFTLTLSKLLEWENKSRAAGITETYQGIELSGKADSYLFLPPDREATAEQKQLEAEGKLMISYGSSEVENETFTSVSWSEGSLQYLISTFENVELNEVIKWAKTVIDSEK